MEELYLVDAYHTDPDDQTAPTSVFLFGHGSGGESVCAEIQGVRTSTLLTWPFPHTGDIVAQVQSKFADVFDDDENDDAGDVRCTIETCREMNGFEPVEDGTSRTRRYMRVSSIRRDVLRRIRGACSYGRDRLLNIVERVDGCGGSGILEPAEPDMDVVQEFLHTYDVRTGQWIRCDLSRVPSIKMSTCRREARAESIGKSDDPSRLPPPIPVMSFDIETGFADIDARKTQYPQMMDPNSAVTYIGVTQRDGRNPDKKVVLALSPSPERDRVLESDAACPVRAYRTEGDLLNGFALLIAEWDPSFIGGYNVWGFDWLWLGIRHDTHDLFRRLAGEHEVVARWKRARERTRAAGVLGGLLPLRRRDDEKTRTVVVPRDIPGMRPGRQTIASVRQGLRQIQEYGGGKREGNGQVVGWEDDILQRYRTAEDVLAAWRHFRGSTAPDSFPHLSRLSNTKCRMSAQKTESSAHGQSFQYRFNMPGRVAFDLYKYVKESPMKMRSYKLKDVGAALGIEQNKIDLEYETMFQYHAGNDPERALEVCRYCLRDTTVPLDIMEKMNMVLGTMSLATLTWLPARVLLCRGQQLRCLTVLLHLARDRGMVFNTRSDIPRLGSYVGATVQEPCCGYTDDPIWYLDFASLYPSIMQSHNFDFSSWVPPSRRRRATALAEESKLQIMEVEGSDGLRHMFVQALPGQPNEGLLPQLLEMYLTARAEKKRAMKRVKKEITDATDDAEKARLGMQLQVLDAEQQGLKICANSAYGFTGVNPDKAMLANPAIADSVTAMGRKHIEDTKQAVLAHPVHGSKARLVYGDTDSVLFAVRFRSLVEAWESGKEVEGWLNKDVLPGMGRCLRMELEEVAWGYVLLAKKMYFGRMYPSGPQGHAHIEKKGIQLARTDQTPFLLKVYQAMVDVIFPEDDTAPPFPRDVVAARISQSLKSSFAPLTDQNAVLEDHYAMSDFVYSKQLRADYKNNNLPHVQMVEDLKRRIAAGTVTNVTVPRPGDKCEYVIVNGAGNISTRTRHPSIVKLKDLDMQYYIKSIRTPLAGVLQWFMTEQQIGEQFEACTAVAVRRAIGVRSIRDYFSAPAPQKKIKA
ncbi:MAG: hypothetical protein CL902_00830 [Dehalococcoidia bacterium]|nr:hypothetical protein [Dehalococcoidia bacterium]